MLVLDMPQGTPEWLQARVGVITASRYKDACGRLVRPRGKEAKQPDFNHKALAYAAEVAIERVSGQPAPQPFITMDMRLGTEREPIARSLYEERSGQWVSQSGLCLTEDKVFGYSSDGFVGDDGLIEIKCPSSPDTIVSLWRTMDLSDYMHQIQGGLWLTGRKWCDFVMYSPVLEPVGKHLLVRRVPRDESFIETMELQLLEFKTLCDDNERALREAPRTEEDGLHVLA